MAKPKPIGYAAGQRIDEALMHTTDALRELTTIIRRGDDIPDTEKITRIARAIDHLYQSSNELKNVKAL